MNAFDVRCPTSTQGNEHNVDWIVSTLAWHCPKCETCGRIEDGTLAITAVDGHRITNEERRTWARLYGGALIEQQSEPHA